MGQAKTRGSFEQRQADAIVDRHQRIEAHKRYEAMVELNRTPEERAARKKSRQSLNTLLAIAAGGLLL